MLGLEVIILIVLGLIWMLVASIEDLTTHEVSDWLNYSFVIAVLGFRFFWSLFSFQGFWFFYWGLIGFCLFFLLGNLFYYSRMFGGGDAKLMYGLGAILPLSLVFSINLKAFLSFIFVFFLVGAIYGLFGSFVLMFANWKKFRKEFFFQIEKSGKMILFVMVFSLVVMGFGFFMGELFYLGGLLVLMAFLFIFSKAIDQSAMIRKRRVSLLREGDWLYRDVKVGSKVVKSDWEGLSKEEIKLLNKKGGKVLVREGLAYVPVFLISFIVWLFLINSELWYSFW